MTDDFDLLQAWSQGDRAAGDTLFQRYYQTVYTFFHLRVSAVADDLTQTTFLACAEAARTLRQRESFRAFVFGIARHKLLDHLRRSKRDAAKVEFTDLVSADSSLSVSRIVAYREEQRLLLMAMEDLPVDTQIALDMFYWQGMTNAEIASVLDVPVSTVTTRLSRARQGLVRAIETMRAPEKPRGSLLSDFEKWATSLRPED